MTNFRNEQGMIDEMCDIIEKRMTIPGKMMFARIAGSHAYNCAIDGSDIDVEVVYTAKTKDVLGLDNIVEVATYENENYKLYEISKVCRMILKGNPNCIEMVSSTDLCHSTPEWDELRDNRYRFISRKMLGQYLGYMGGQLQRIEKGLSLHTGGGEYNTKWAYHIIRLGRDAVQISKGILPDVRKVGDEREMLLDIRNGEYSADSIKTIAEGMVREVEHNKPWPLPKEGDKEWLNGWLLERRLLDLSAETDLI